MVQITEQKRLFFCNSCGWESPKWVGRCGGCSSWNTLDEAPRAVSSRNSRSGALRHGQASAQSTPLSEVSRSSLPRIFSGLAECDRVLGGGCVPGSLTLLSGDPGVGKSTLVLQILKGLAYQGHTIVYVSGEESPHQILMRAERLGAVHPKIHVSSNTSLESIFELCEKHRPSFLVVDSVQTIASDEISSSPGSVLQVRECTARLMTFCKSKTISCFLIGQVTKDGQVAGPKLLEHLVDTVLYLEGDSSLGCRLLRSIKNRFGGTGEIGVFIMGEKGLEEVASPSSFFLSREAGRPVAGSAISVAMEGSRPLLVELQVLVGQSTYANPRRIVTGLDSSRLSILIAVLEKRAGLSFNQNDVFASVAGGLRLTESAHDLALLSALVSSHRNFCVPDRACFFGETSLSGDLRPVAHAPTRVREAIRLGLSRIYMPRDSYEKDKSSLDALCFQEGGPAVGLGPTRPQIIPIANVGQLLGVLRGLAAGGKEQGQAPSPERPARGP